jgi:hypothetical protein
LSREDRVIAIQFHELEILDDLLRRKWASFVADAPAAWRLDNWLNSRAPVGVVSTYGQNVPLPSDNATEEELGNWTSDHSLQHGRYLSMALATHLQYVLAIFFANFRFQFISIADSVKWSNGTVSIILMIFHVTILQTDIRAFVQIKANFP